MKNTKRILLAAVAALLLVAVSVGGTLAWLTATTTPVINTFTESNIDITLTESTNLDLKMVPGKVITKDPEVAVVDGSEDCWLFVKVEKSENFDSFMTYTMADGWQLVDGTTNVYARKVLATATTKTFSVLANDKVTVKTSVTKEDMKDLTADTYPTLTFTAYATQLYKSNNTEFTAKEAWAAYSNPTDTPPITPAT